MLMHTYMGLWHFVYQLCIVTAHMVKGWMSFIKKIFFYFVHFYDDGFLLITCHYPSKQFCSCFRLMLRWSTGKPSWRQRTGSREGRDPGSPRDGRQILSCTSLYMLLYLFMVLNEMFPLVYFLEGYVGKVFGNIVTIHMQVDHV